MIIVNLKGGLGNQMFQYACGRALSLRSGESEFKLDIYGLEKAEKVGDIYRPYALSNYDIKAKIADHAEIGRLRNRFGIVSKIWRLFRTKILRQYYVDFAYWVAKPRKNAYLDGFFQTERYFVDYKDLIRRDFKPITLSPVASKWLAKISSFENSASLHIRRGDYIGHKTFGNICTDKYYRTATEKLSESVKNCHFFVFSNDIDWVKHYMTLPADIEFVSSNELKDFEEITLMSTCRHNIIANSSFSWWGAWLNENPEKIVIAPKKWAHGIYNIWKMRDITPPSWIRI